MNVLDIMKLYSDRLKPISEIVEYTYNLDTCELESEKLKVESVKYVSTPTIAEISIRRKDAMGNAYTSTAYLESLGVVNADGRKLVMWVPSARTEEEETDILKFVKSEFTFYLNQAIGDLAERNETLVTARINLPLA